MRVVIVPSDSLVGIDGEFRTVAGLAAMFQSVHAVQWYGDAGEVEFTDGNPNVSITDIADIQPAIDAWNALTPPPKTEAELLQEAKVARISVIESAYQSANTAPISYLGAMFQTDADSVALMAQVATAIPAGGHVEWYDVDNIGHQLSDAQFTELRQAILLRGQPLFVQRQSLKSAIRNATTIEQAEAVVWA